MTICPGAKDDMSDGEYDELPRSLRWRLKFAKMEVDDRYGCQVARLRNNRIVKKGCESTEYEALRVVDRHTSVPIPKVLGVYQLRDEVLVEYEIMPGRRLDTAWSILSAAQRRKVIDELGRFIGQLRKMEPPKHIVIGSATMGAAYDRRFGRGRIGPFYSLESFHDYVRRGHATEDFTEQEISRCHNRKTPYQLKFTHADLCPRNVLIDESGKICSIIGWEHAGWYPEYWEFTQMHHATPKEMGEWLQAMRKVMPKYEEELAADDALRKRYSGSIYDSPRSVRAVSPTQSELAVEQKEINDLNTEHTSG
jgi:aminoglycoside phosphotransferase (APT) family kinase protein